MAKVFISHSWKDNEIATKIYNNLKSNGANTWIDYVELKPGEELPKRISLALEWCDTLVVIWSKSAIDSYYVGLEWQAALDMQKKIILCLTDDTPRPAILRSFRYIDFRNFTYGYEKLLNTLDLRQVKPSVLTTETSKIPHQKRLNEKKNVLKIGYIFIVILIFVFTGIYLVNRFSPKNDTKSKIEEKITDTKSTEDSLKTYWEKRQPEMDASYKKAQQSDSNASLNAKSKAQVWNEFLTKFATDNPFITEDNNQCAEATTRWNYWREKWVQDSLATIEKSKPPIANTSTEKTVKGMKLVLIPDGTFQKGDTFGDGYDVNEKPVHTVKVSNFYMSKTEVTNAQFCQFLNEKGNQTEGGATWLEFDNKYCLVTKQGGKFVPKSGYENHPVIMVSWYGARAFAIWAGYRLPTETEWEYAARNGGKKVKYPNGDNLTHNDANFRGTKGKDRWDKTSPVASFPPNELGLYDMAGNVWEWCYDWYADKYDQNLDSNNPKGPSSGTNRVLRGGSWNDYEWDCRSSRRVRESPVSRSDNKGFRVVQDSLKQLPPLKLRANW